MVKTRIAPSPTGDPHIGTAYTALFNYAFARKNDGKFLLRIEDTDRQRLVEGADKKIVKALEWLGLEIDEGPFYQSDRLELYQKAAKMLVEKGLAYYCDCSPERLEKLREEQQQKKQVPRYDRKCRSETPKKLTKGSFVIRMKVPEQGETSFEDQVRGRIVFQNKDIDDGVILKSDGWPTYHLAVVVDDHDMEVTHVIRAEEWLSSTPKHVLLYQGLNYSLPEFAHLPLLRNSDRSKISKRKNPVSLEWYREQGYLPEALRNYLALMGWSMPDEKEIFTLEDFIQNFDLGRVDAGGPVFDLQKLDWLNGEWIRKLDDKSIVEKLTDYSKFSKDQIVKVLPLVKERLKKLSDFDGLVGYFFEEPNILKEEILPKGKETPEVGKVLEEILKDLESVGDWKSGKIEQVLEKKPEKFSWSRTDLFQTVRYIMTGSRATPPLFETLEAIGRNSCLVRLQRARQMLGS